MTFRRLALVGALLATSVQSAFTDVVDVSGLLFAIFYIGTALATITFYRRLVTSSLKELILVGVLPLASAGFLVWIVVKSLITAPAAQLWSLVGIVVVGVVLMAIARWSEKAPFFFLPRQQYQAPVGAAPNSTE